MPSAICLMADAICAARCWNPSGLGCTFTVFTLLREPRAQLFSWWNHFKRAAGATLTSAARGAANELQSHHFAAMRLDRTGCTPELLRVATERLEQYDVVGLTEQLDATLLSVSERSGLPFRPRRRRELVGQYFNGAACDANRTDCSSHTSSVRLDGRLTNGSAALAALPTAALQTLLDGTVCDRALYATFATRFRALAAAQGLHARVAHALSETSVTGEAEPTPPLLLRPRVRICAHEVPTVLRRAHWDSRWAVGGWDRTWRGVSVEAYFPACNFSVLRVVPKSS